MPMWAKAILGIEVKDIVSRAIQLTTYKGVFLCQLLAMMLL